MGERGPSGEKGLFVLGKGGKKRIHTSLEKRQLWKETIKKREINHHVADSTILSSQRKKKEAVVGFQGKKGGGLGGKGGGRLKLEGQIVLKRKGT